MVGWIVADAEAYTIGETATLTATSEADLNDYVTWQTKVQDGEWKTTGFGNILKVDLTEENANNFYRFRMEDGNFSDGIQLTVAPALVEETAEEVTEEKAVEEEQIEVEEEVAEEQVEAKEVTEEEQTEVEEEVAEEQVKAEEVTEEEQSEAEEEVAEEQNEVEEETEEEIEETEEEVAEEEPLTDEEMLAMGYKKVSIAYTTGTDIFGTMNYEEEPIGHFDFGEEIWVSTTDDLQWAKLYSANEDADERYVMWNEIIILLQEETEEAEETEQLPRSISIRNTLAEMGGANFGTTIEISAELINFQEDDQCTFYWYYSEDDGLTWNLAEGENEQVLRYVIDSNNWYYRWKVIVAIDGE